MLSAKIEALPGGGWEGHVFFKVSHPINGKSLSSNSIKQIEEFCLLNKIYYDRDLVLEIIKNLIYEPKYGWLVPKDKIDQNRPITSCHSYLKEIQKDLF